MSIETFETVLQVAIFVLVAAPIVGLIVAGGRRTGHLNQVPFGFGPDRPRIEAELEVLTDHERDTECTGCEQPAA